MDKQKAEESLLSFHERPVCALRLFNVFGLGQKRDSPYSGVLTIFSDNINKNMPLKIFGDGHQSRDFVHVNDVCKTILSALSKPIPNFSVINVGSGKGISISDLAKLISETGVVSELPESEIIFSAKRPGDVRHSTADLSGLEQFLDKRDMIPLDAGLQDLIERTLHEYDA